MYFPLFVRVRCLSLFSYALLCVHSSFAIILKRRRTQVALLLLSYRWIVTINVLWLFLTVPWIGLQCVIVVIPDHSHLLSDAALLHTSYLLRMRYHQYSLCFDLFSITFIFFTGARPWTQGSVNKLTQVCKNYNTSLNLTKIHLTNTGIRFNLGWRCSLNQGLSIKTLIKWAWEILSL